MKPEPEALVARMEELCAQTTPGPWEVRKARTLLHITSRNRGRGVTAISTYPPRIPERDMREEAVRYAEGDAYFIAEAREAIPQLIAALRETDAGQAFAEHLIGEQAASIADLEAQRAADAERIAELESVLCIAEKHMDEVGRSIGFETSPALEAVRAVLKGEK